MHSRGGFTGCTVMKACDAREIKVRQLSNLFSKYHLGGLPEEEYREMLSLTEELRKGHKESNISSS